MRLLLLIAGPWFASIAGAAGSAGTYVLQCQQGPIEAKIEVGGTALAGSIDLAGQVSERGRWRVRDGVLFVLGQNGQWARVGTYGMSDDGSTMRITYDGGGRNLWSRQ